MPKELLARAILAFDVILEDVMTDIRDGIEPNSIAIQIMKMLCSQVPGMPEVEGRLQEYVLNMADLNARIKLLTMSCVVEESQLETVIGKQRERLAELDQEVNIIKVPIHKGSSAVN